MFPSLKVNLIGLEENLNYILVVDIVPLDDNRYKFHNGTIITHYLQYSNII